MLLESAIGDSYGSGFEYVSTEIVEKYGNALEYRQHPKHTQLKAGRYTDDTQMSLAIAEAMLDDDPWTAASLSQRFVDVFKRDERTGYSGKFYGVLTKVKDGKELLDTIIGTSDRSGGAMRASPIGLYSDPIEVIIRSTLQASITHNSHLGLAAAVASALTTHYFCYRHGPKADLGRFLDLYTPRCKEVGSWSRQYASKVKSQGWMSVLAAVWAIKTTNSMSELLKKCVSYTGDVDTVATIALAAASFSDEHTQDLPVNLVDGLENETYGKDYLIDLDKKLMSRVKRPNKK